MGVGDILCDSIRKCANELTLCRLTIDRIQRQETNTANWFVDGEWGRKRWGMAGRAGRVQTRKTGSQGSGSGMGRVENRQSCGYFYSRQHCFPRFLLLLNWIYAIHPQIFPYLIRQSSCTNGLSAQTRLCRDSDRIDDGRGHCEWTNNSATAQWNWLQTQGAWNAWLAMEREETRKWPERGMVTMVGVSREGPWAEGRHEARREWLEEWKGRWLQHEAGTDTDTDRGIGMEGCLSAWLTRILRIYDEWIECRKQTD